MHILAFGIGLISRLALCIKCCNILHVVCTTSIIEISSSILKSATLNNRASGALLFI